MLLTVSTEHVKGDRFVGVIRDHDETIIRRTPRFENRKAAYKAAQKLRDVLMRNERRLPNPFFA